MKTITVYCFELRDDLDNLVMSTEIDNDPNPAADAEFWARFMQGDCVMAYTGFVGEEVEE